MMVDAYVGPALVSEADAASRVRALRVFSAAQRERVGAAVSAVLSRWQSAWDWRGARTETGRVEVRVSNAADPAHAGYWNKKWMVCEFSNPGAGLPNLRWRAGDAEATSDVLLERFAACLWGTADERRLPEPAPAPESIAAEVASAMWRDFWRHWALAGSAPHGTAEVPAEIGEVADVAMRTVDGSRPDEFFGVLLVEFCVTGLQWAVALDAASVDAILAKSGEEQPQISPKALKSAGLARVDAALGQRTLALGAYLLPCTLSLGALQNLRVGDVIALEHPLDQPAQVFSEKRERVAHAWMAQTSGFKSLELAGTQP
jgi:hypothetical protein